MLHLGLKYWWMGSRNRTEASTPNAERAGAKLMYHFGKGHTMGFPVVCDNAESHDSLGAESKLCCRQVVVDVYLM